MYGYEPAFDQDQAIREGWCLMNRFEGRPEIQRDDDSQAFPGDEDAWFYVISQALIGSTYHKSALRIVKDENPNEWSAVLRTWSIAEGAV